MHFVVQVRYWNKIGVEPIETVLLTSDLVKAVKTARCTDSLGYGAYEYVWVGVFRVEAERVYSASDHEGKTNAFADTPSIILERGKIEDDWDEYWSDLSLKKAFALAPA